MIKKIIYENTTYEKRTKYSKIKASSDKEIPEKIIEVFNSGQINYDAYSRKDFNVDEIEFGNNIKEVKAYAFSACPYLKKVVLTPSIKTLHDYSFNCAYELSEINLENIEEIGKYSFAGCTNLKTISLNKIIKIDESAFAASGLERIVLPEGLIEIGNKSFTCCLDLKSISLPKSLTKIENLAFHECAKLESIEFPDTIREIGAFSFRSCDSLEKITLPDNIEFIGELAFGYCKNLKSISWRGYIYHDKVEFRDALIKQKVAKSLVWF